MKRQGIFKDETLPNKWALYNIRWKKLLKIDWLSMIFLITVLFLAWSYQHDVGKCQEVINDPVTFCSNICLETNYSLLNSEGGVYESKNGIIPEYFERLKKEE